MLACIMHSPTPQHSTHHMPPWKVVHFLCPACPACSTGPCVACCSAFHLILACSKDSTSVIACYLELAEKVRAGLGHIDPYFAKLADGMVAWIEAWQALNPDFAQ